VSAAGVILPGIVQSPQASLQFVNGFDTAGEKHHGALGKQLVLQAAFADAGLPAVFVKRSCGYGKLRHVGDAGELLHDKASCSVRSRLSAFLTAADENAASDFRHHRS
jgi:hypothetical protein